MLKNRPIHLKLDSATELKESIKVVTQTNIRNLLVPSDTFNVYPTIWPEHELDRIEQAGYIVTKEERRERLNKLEADKCRLEEECEERKRQLKKIDNKRGGGQEKKLEEKDGDDSSSKVLNRAFVAKQEEVIIKNILK